jgi:hypothetical protein
VEIGNDPHHGVEVADVDTLTRRLDPKLYSHRAVLFLLKLKQPTCVTKLARVEHKRLFVGFDLFNKYVSNCGKRSRKWHNSEALDARTQVKFER